MADKNASKASEETPAPVETAATMAAPGDDHDANKTTQPNPDDVGSGGADFKLPHRMDLITIPGEKDDGSDTVQVTGRRWTTLSADAAKRVREYAGSRKIQVRERPTEKKGS